jgi:hypothetical protein
MANINIKTQSLLPVRRDGQVSSGSSGSIGGTIISSNGSGVGNSSTYDPSPIYVYVDGSLARRDASITNLYTIKANLTDLYPFATNASVGLFKTNYIDPSLNAKVNKAGDTMTGTLINNVNVVVKGKVNTDTIDSSLSYISGFAGQGYKLENVSGKLNLVLDNLTVREKLSAYELEIREINSVNGGLMISVANGIPYSVVGTRLYFDTDGNVNPIQFAVNDYVRAQQWTGAGIGSYIGLVTNVVQSATLGSAYIDASTISGTAWSKMKLVQVGNSSDTSRQNLIYITASDTNNPYIDMLANVSTGSFTGTQKLRIGNLTGITDANFGGALTGYGLYGNNVYLNGQIVIAGGSGYANLSDKPSSLSGINSTEGTKLGGIATGATVGATWGTNLNSIPSFLGSPGAAGLYLTSTYMGYWNGSSFPSYIDNAGNAKFVNCIEFGTGTAPINLGNGYGAIAIKGNEIWENTQNGVGTLCINYHGYQGGLTQPRITAICDGQGNSVATFAASGTEVFGGLRVDGATLGIGTITSQSTMTATNFIGSSDERLKTNIKPLRFKSIPIKYKEFELKSELGQKRVGVIAQEIQKTNPEFVREDKEGMLSVAYTDLMMAKIAELECRIKELEGKQ